MITVRAFRADTTECHWQAPSCTRPPSPPALFAQVRFFLIHRRELSTDCIHFDFAAIGLHDRESGFGALGPTQIYCLFEFREFGVDVQLQRPDSHLLPGLSRVSSES